MQDNISRKDMVNALVSFAHSQIMATSEMGEDILSLALHHYYDDMSYNELDIRFGALMASKYSHLVVY